MNFIIQEMIEGKNVIAPCFSKATGEKLYALIFGDTKTIIMHNSEN
jgi:hypothetical protein